MKAEAKRQTACNKAAFYFCVAVLLFFVSTLPVSAMFVAETDGYTENTDIGYAPDVDMFGDLSFSFTTDANNYTFNSVKLFLSSGSGGDNGTFSVTLHEDAGNAPGVFLEQLAGDDHPIGNNAEHQYVGSSMLTANTTYWITLSNNDATGENYYDFWGSSTTDESAASTWSIGDDIYSSLMGFQETNGPFVSQFDATAVPLPTSALLFLSGILSLPVLRRR
jgi:hypothetical protein